MPAGTRTIPRTAIRARGRQLALVGCPACRVRQGPAPTESRQLVNRVQAQRTQPLVCAASVCRRTLSPRTSLHARLRSNAQRVPSAMSAAARIRQKNKTIALIARSEQCARLKTNACYAVTLAKLQTSSVWRVKRAQSVTSRRQIGLSALNVAARITLVLASRVSRAMRRELSIPNGPAVARVRPAKAPAPTERPARPVRH